ncbi:hypothetical protein F2Q70_00030196 [Brassica cretica]|uniref:Uncharacterized protein n=1 Tax=Brassica cretica TaxID=69181 RepID=A0A8S9FJZ1_BRACR|nr:hypothetical protein F2Q70_00030196 [Brassica cretica]
METEAARFRKLPQGSDSDSDSDSEAGSGRPMKLPCNVEGCVGSCTARTRHHSSCKESMLLSETMPTWVKKLARKYLLFYVLNEVENLSREAHFLMLQMHTPTNFMYCGMISTVVGGIIPIYPYTIVDDKALTAENLNVLGTPAREIIKGCVGSCTARTRHHSSCKESMLLSETMPTWVKKLARKYLLFYGFLLSYAPSILWFSTFLCSFYSMVFYCLLLLVLNEVEKLSREAHFLMLQMHTPTNFMYCGMISTVLGGIIPISPYTIVNDKALTAENLKVLGTPAREIIKGCVGSCTARTRHHSSCKESMLLSETMPTWVKKLARKQMHTPTEFMYCGMISAVVGGIIPISPYTTVDDKVLTAENLKVLGTPAQEIIKVHPLLSLCEIQAKAKKI